MAGEDEPPRSAAARAAAELALVRVVHHYGGLPEFILLGGLVPALLCAGSPRRHAGTTDVDVQVNLEIAGGAVHAVRLEQALRKAGFEPDDARVWRWNMRDPTGVRATVKFELLADLDTEPAGVTVAFDDCESLGAANLRGTGYAAADNKVHHLVANDEGIVREAHIRVTGLAGFLLAKVAAAYGRRKPKDWYDIAFVLLHNDAGDADAAAQRVLDVFGPPVGEMLTQLHDLEANFTGAEAQGAHAYVEQLTLDHPDLDPATVATDGELAVLAFVDRLMASAA